MINTEMQKRILTSIILFTLLVCMYNYIYVLIIALILVSSISWIEFYALTSKIFKKETTKNIFLRFFCKSGSLLYLFFFSFIIIQLKLKNIGAEIFIVYSVMICITSDIGGLLIGRFFKGKKLTQVSPNKTISGSIGSFVFSLLLIPFFYKHFNNHEVASIIVITLLISFTSQIGDLFVSLLKRKAKVKDTGDLLPGHGGFLDRIDGILFAVPITFLLFNLF
jgi:phosphatidate cytidylyltransferase